MIVDFFLGFQARMAARGFSGPVLLGLDAIAGQSDPTGGRVVCFPTTDPIQPTTRVGGNPRARKTRMASLEMHIWGAVAFSPSGAIDTVQSLRNTEALIQTCVNATMDLAVGTSDFSPVQWDERTAVARAGWLAILTVTVEVPIVDVTYDVPTASELVVVTQDTFAKPDGTPALDSPNCGVP